MMQLQVFKYPPPPSSCYLIATSFPLIKLHVYTSAKYRTFLPMTPLTYPKPKLPLSRRNFSVMNANVSNVADGNFNVIDANFLSIGTSYKILFQRLNL